MIDLPIEAVRAARERIREHVRLTPVLAWEAPGFTPALTLKLEQLQVGGSFKARGACNRIFGAPAEALGAGVVTASGGNHGLGVAWAARRRGVPAMVYLPEGAPASTERRLAELGASVSRVGRAWDDAWAEAERRAAATGALLVHPFEDLEVIAGQGTIGLELMEQVPDVDLVVVAIGGGGLAAGVAAAVRAIRPEVRVVGVEPTGAPSMRDSLAAGRVIELDQVRTIAGTLAPRAVGPNTLALVGRYLEDVVLVDDGLLRATMGLLWEEARVLVEPAGAATVAALMGGLVPLKGARRPVALVCGANLDPELAMCALR